MANYMLNYTNAMNGCQVGDKLFYNFNYSSTSSGATGPSAAQVNVVGDPANPNEPGLIFASTGWTVNGVATLANPLYIDSNITFTVQVIDLQPLIIDASLDFDHHFNVGGNGVADIGETVTFDGGSSSTGLEVDSANGPFTDTKNFPGVGFVRVQKDLIVTVPGSPSGPVSGSATITQFREGFSEGAPEPISTLLIGSGLVGFALLRRRKR
jgi:hypothetical protein